MILVISLLYTTSVFLITTNAFLHKYCVKRREYNLTNCPPFLHVGPVMWGLNRQIAQKSLSIKELLQLNKTLKYENLQLKNQIKFSIFVAYMILFIYTLKDKIGSILH